MLHSRAKIRNLASGTNWYTIRNVATDVTELFIYDEISFYGVTADQFVRDLQAIGSTKLNVRINSPGGDVFDGIAIYNALRQHPATVTVQVDSLAASIASVIAQAGDERTIMPHGQMMIHEASGIMMGNSEEMAKFSELLDKQSALIAEIYAERGPFSADEYRDLMRSETWLSDAESVEFGLMDRIATITKPEADEPEAPPVNNSARWLDLMAKAEAESLEACS